MKNHQADRPLLVYDGDCGFCRLWIDRWRASTGERVRYAPFQEVAGRFARIPPEQFSKAVQLIFPDGKVRSAAHAVFETLSYAPGQSWMLWSYKHLPGVAPISEWAYALVAAHRPFFSRLTRWFWGDRVEPPSCILTRWLFLRLLGIVYLIAFLSLLPQILGLVGSGGILPAGQFLEAVRENIGGNRYWIFPTLAWINVSDAFLRGMTWVGMLVSILAIAGIATVPALIVLWVLHLSLVTAGQDFMMFQWDALLLETGFLAILFAPWQVRPDLGRERQPSRAAVWLLRLLLWRLMFSSGVVKLRSGDPTWRNLTALTYHYETQPLPTPIGWFMHQLPKGFHKVSAGVTFFIELAVPFLIFFPRRLRFIGAGTLILLQGLIALTGNYTYFSLLTIALCIPLFDDAALARLVPSRWRGQLGAPAQRTREVRWKRGLTLGLAIPLMIAGLAETPGVHWGERLPRPAAKVLTGLRALHIVSGYGLFAVMTTSRPEIIIEGSRDGETWLAYEFKDKAGDLMRPPPWVAPHQPRLDWQMWFAALGGYRENRWFSTLILRLLQGSPEVLALFAKNPFPESPPRYVRALVYNYRFTDFATRRATGAWWQRELLGLYFPPVSLP